MLDTVFLEVLNRSVIVSYVIVAVILIRFILKKAPKTFVFALWSVVLLRLLCPFTFESFVGFMPKHIDPIPQDIIYQKIPEVHTGIDTVDAVINESLPPVTHPEASVNPIQIQLFIGQILWLVGIIVMISISCLQAIKLKRKLVGATPLRDNIYLADHIDSAFVMGMLRPRIYLPSTLDTEVQSIVIAHEACHIKRFDTLTRLLAFSALTVYWFHPLVWVAWFLSGKDMERACDEMAMQGMPKERRITYANTLLRLATGKRVHLVTPLGFGDGDTKGRVKHILHYKKPIKSIAIILTVCVGMILLVLGTNNSGLGVRDTMHQAQNLSVDTIATLELVTFPEHRDNSYALIKEAGYGDIVNLINASSGTYVEAPDKVEGAGQYFYVTQKDGSRLIVGNVGNTYLQINDDYFEAEYEWLSQFTKFVGHEPLPEHFHYGAYQPTAGDTKRIALFRAIPIGTKRDEVQEQFGRPTTRSRWGYEEVYELEAAQVKITYSTDATGDGRVEDVVINTHPKLSLEDVVMLAEKGEALTWGDFEVFPYTDDGSGVYIRRYAINERFALAIGGGSTESQPMYIILHTIGEPEQSIDIRTEDVTAFIHQYEKVDTATQLGVVDRVEVVRAGGNPAYGCESKRITNPDEVAAFVKAFDTYEIDKNTELEDVNAQASYYRLYSGEELVETFIFNGNDTTRMWIDNEIEIVVYEGQAPHALYEASSAEMFIAYEDEAMTKAVTAAKLFVKDTGANQIIDYAQPSVVLRTLEDTVTTYDLTGQKLFALEDETVYEITFATEADDMLGPIVCYVDAESFNVLGVALRR